MPKMTKDQQILVVVAFGFIVFCYFYWGNFLKPTMSVINEREKKLQELTQRVQSAEMESRRLPQLQADLADLQSKLTLLEKQLPTEKDFPGILRLVTKEVTKENLELNSLTPVDPKREQYFDVLSFDMALTGSLHNFVRFMTSMGQQERIFQFERVNFSLGGNKADSGLIFLNITFTLKTYAYVG